VTGLADRVRRARKDVVATAIAAAAELGLKFRWRGADLVISGTSKLSDRDRGVLEFNLPQILERLGNGSLSDASILTDLGVRAELITTEDRAREVVASLPDSCGLDVETEPLPEHALPRPPLVITRKGGLAVYQPDHRDPAGLDPHRARPRLIQVFDPDLECVFLFDMQRVPIEALDGLWSRRLVAHNAAFEHGMLGGRPVNLFDSMQLAGLALGCEGGARRLANVAEKILGIELPKALQISDWSAPRLSISQLAYAAADAVVCHHAARSMWRMLGKRERRAFELQNAVVQIVAGMRVKGCPFDPVMHTQTIQAWEIEHAEERERFRQLTGEEPPGQSGVGDWLEARLPAEDIAWMPRTESGKLSARAEHLKHLAHHEEIRPLLRVLWSDKRLRSFGHSLLGLISPVTGRLHCDFMVCGARTGRITCNKPNLQQLPPDARRAVVAPPGKVLICADYSQIELRVLAELARDGALRRVFAEGRDVHAEAAARIAGIPVEDVIPEQRKSAKAIVFGTVYGSGARGLRATAWANFGIELSIEQAGAAKAALLNAFPGICDYQREQADRAEQDGVLWSIAGRPLRAAWEKDGAIRYTVAVNYAVQASAADVLLLAMANVERALPGAMILTVHDELVLEVPENRAEEASAFLSATMGAAFSELFPGAPLAGLIAAKVGRRWADLK
jgi:DNA polymerase I